MRKGMYSRTTRETDICVAITVDGDGTAECRIPVPFLTHMLDAMCRHGGFTLDIEGKGDCEIDVHHFVEDAGFVIGKAFADALGDFRGIFRAGSCIMPMDESLVMAALDFSGRPYCECEFGLGPVVIGTCDTESIEEFFAGFSRGAGVTLHITAMKSGNAHHTVEAAFKAFGRALARACERSGIVETSTKGVIERGNNS